MKKVVRFIPGAESGQALVLVLLSLAVVLTLVLFILSRSVTDILVSSKTEEAARAFSAAEAGIEQALVIGTGGSSTLSNNSGFVSNVALAGDNSTSFNYPIELSSGDSMTTWFVAHDPASGNLSCSDQAHPCFDGSSIKVCWGKGTFPDANTSPAIELSLFYETSPGNPGSVKIGRAAIDPASGRRLLNNFSAPDAGTCSVGGTNYVFGKTINFSDLVVPGTPLGTANVLQFARIRMFYNTSTQPVGVSVFTGALPSQGQDISSTGTVGDPNSPDSVRKVQVFQGWPEPPSVFDYPIYSGTGLNK